ncbi:MAG TPA: hypothetical protein PKN32_11555 [Bacteroidales bacterium]|nr:hypothetical protein [Bacteroidales bacterium]
MRLLFVYIHNFGNIKQQGFNLSSDYDIKFTSDVDKDFNGTSNLTINKIEHNLPHLFHKRIVDVKGIVGENGAGKTTLIKYLAFECHEHVMYINDLLSDNPNIIVYESENYSGSATLEIYIDNRWENSNPQISIDSSINLKTNKVFLRDIRWDSIPDFYNTAFIHYSNIFDNRYEDEYNGLINISTNYLIKNDLKTYSNQSFSTSEVLAHKLVEMQRQCSFAIQFNDQLPFKLPTFLNIFVNDISQAAIRDYTKNYKQNSSELSIMNPLIIDWFNCSNDAIIIDNQRPENNVLKVIKRAFFNYFIANYILDISEINVKVFPDYKKSTIEIFVKLIEAYKTTKGDVNLDDFTKECELIENNIKSIPHAFGDKFFNIELGDSSFVKQLHLFKDLLFEFEKSAKYASLISFNHIQIPLDSVKINILTAYARTARILSYLDFYFEGLSSGEQGFLTTFSRFHSLVYNLSSVASKIEEHKSNLIILIDEGDLYFHPKWQSQYLKFINNILPKIFSNQKIQIILTSHSQFIASDLPKNHLLFLRKETDEDLTFKDGTKALGTCKVVDGPEVTFAANIHDLLSDSFFLEGAHIGGFAKDVLHKLIDQLEHKSDCQYFTDEQIVSLIKSIGERWIANRLMEKYRNYIKSNIVL